MTMDELLIRLSHPLPWGQHLFGIDITGQNVAHRIVDWDLETEVVRLKAIGDYRIVEHHVSYLYEIEGDVCSCGELNCEWHLSEAEADD